MSNKRALLEALYAQIPKMQGCDGRCWRSCGPVVQLGMMTPYELSRLRDVERTGGTTPADCELLTADHQCRAYELRPFICRLWGAVPSMPCVFGCKPERYLSENEAQAIHRQIIALSGSREYAYADTSAALATIKSEYTKRMQP